MTINNINKIPIGYTKGIYKDRTYGIEKTVFNKGRSIKIYAKELGGNNFISLNYYITDQKSHLKPCEMPEEKVIDFLKNVNVI